MHIPERVTVAAEIAPTTFKLVSCPTLVINGWEGVATVPINVGAVQAFPMLTVPATVSASSIPVCVMLG